MRPRVLARAESGGSGESCRRSREPRRTARSRRDTGLGRERIRILTRAVAIELVVGLASVTLVTAPAGRAAAAPPPGTLGWIQRYSGPGGLFDAARDVAVSPDGSKVFVTGYSLSDSAPADFLTLAYNPATGAPIWTKRYSLTGTSTDEGRALAVSPDGSTVFVSGYVWRSSTSPLDILTVAFDASTGATRWSRTFSGPDGDGVSDIILSPDGATLFVVGGSVFSTGADYLTIAYRATTGETRWARRYSGLGPFMAAQDIAESAAVSADGSTIFVTGTSFGGSLHEDDIVTIAYSAITGKVLWFKRYNDPSSQRDSAKSIVVSPDGSRIFVTGVTRDPTDEFITIAYNATTGDRIWVRQYGPGINIAYSVATNPAGTIVFITGSSQLLSTLNSDFMTIAYDALTGSTIWARRYGGTGGHDDDATDVIVSADGTKIFVTGRSWGGTSTDHDYATIGYNAVTGATLWARRYNGSANGEDTPAALAVTPDSTKVVVTGYSTGQTTDWDYATIAYNA